MATIASLIVDVRADTAQLTKGVNDINGSLDKVGAVASKLGGMLVTAFSVQAITGAVKSFLDFTSAMADLSTKTGISTTELQKLKYAAEQNGGTIDAVAKGVTRMGRALVEGDTGTVNAMKRLGLSFAEVRNMDPASAFAMIGDAIAKVPNPLERSKLAMDLFGKSGAELLPTMAGNLTATMKAAETLGIVLDEQTIKAGDDLGDTLASLQSVGTAIIGKVLAPMLPAFQMVANAMLGAGNVVDYLRNMFDALLRMALLTVKGLIDAATYVGELALKIPGLSKVIGDDAAAMRGMKDASEWLGGAISGLEKGTQTATVATKAMIAPVVLLSDGQEKAAKAAAAHAKELQGISDKLTGAGLIKAADDYVTAIKRGIDVHKLTAEAQAEVNKVMKAAIEVYEAQGRIAPQAMRDLYVETLKLPPAIALLDTSWKTLGEHIDVSIPIVKSWGVAVVSGISDWNNLGQAVGKPVVPEAVKKVHNNVSDLAKALAQLATIGGDSFGALVRGASTLVAAFDTLQKSQKSVSEGIDSFKSGDKLQGIAGIAAGIGGIVSAGLAAGQAIKGMWDHFFGTAGRDVVTQFAATLGGFDSMHVKLLTLGDAGEALWIKLTQGVGRNSPDQAKLVIEEINAALAGQDAWMQRLPGLIDRYGLSWADAGIKAKQSHMDEIAKGLIQDFADLTKAGFDVVTITEHMSVAINDYVHEAMKTGTEIPAAMKPLLQKMIELGTLTNAAGETIGDLGELTFATTLTEGFKSVVDAIKDLTKALAGDLGGALDALGRKKVVIPIGFEVEPVPTGPGDGSPPANSVSRFNSAGLSLASRGGGGGGGYDSEAAAADRHFVLVQIPKAITAALQKGAA